VIPRGCGTLHLVTRVPQGEASFAYLDRRQDLITLASPDSRRALGQRKRHCLRSSLKPTSTGSALSAANDFALTPPGAKYLGAERFRVHLVGPVDPDGADRRQSGQPAEVGFRRFSGQLAANRSKFYWDFASGPFYGFNRPGADVSQPIILNWWRQGMMGGAKAHYDGVVAFSQTDFTEDLKKITVPVLVMHGDDDQIVPYADSAPLSAKLLKNSTLKTYKGFPHGMPTTQAETINTDLLEFFRA
jgi:pimeloyl-ACP methyl ester carboxylesterase